MRANGDKIAMLTCYDASFAALCDAQGVDVLLIGDSLGMVLQGHDSTLPVSVADMAYHTTSVARGCQRALILDGRSPSSLRRYLLDDASLGTVVTD